MGFNRHPKPQLFPTGGVGDGDLLNEFVAGHDVFQPVEQVRSGVLAAGSKGEALAGKLHASRGIHAYREQEQHQCQSKSDPFHPCTSFA